MNETAVNENFKWLVNMGYAARGAIYLIVGGLRYGVLKSLYRKTDTSTV